MMRFLRYIGGGDPDETEDDDERVLAPVLTRERPTRPARAALPVSPFTIGQPLGVEVRLGALLVKAHGTINNMDATRLEIELALLSDPTILRCPSGTPVTLISSYGEATGTGTALYLGPVTREPPWRIQVTRPAALQAVQRRESKGLRYAAAVDWRILRTANGRGSSGLRYRATSFDISSGGIGFEASAPLVSGDVLELEITYEPGFTIRCHGTVRHATPGVSGSGGYRIGVEFDDLLPADLERLKRFVFIVARRTGG